jgi:hypothetical protein
MSIKLVKIALANLLRHRTRTVLSATGLALAIATVLFVNVIALSFEAGVTAVYDYIRQTPEGIANVWITPTGGFTLDADTGFFKTPAFMPVDEIDELKTGVDLSKGEVVQVLTESLPVTDPPLVIYGRSDQSSVWLSPSAAIALNAAANQSITLENIAVKVDRIALPDLGAGNVALVPLEVAGQILKRPDQLSWLMLRQEGLPKLRRDLLAAGLSATTDPTVTKSDGKAIAYFLEGRYGREDIVSFGVKFAALYINQASSTLLGWLAKITLALGFVLMLSAALLSIEERRREFGIMVAVGVSGDVLYLFLMESLLLFAGSTLIGLWLGIILLQGLTPELLDWGVVMKSMALVICYIPPMIVFGSLIPAQMLLQKSPVQLLRAA